MLLLLKFNTVFCALSPRALDLKILNCCCFQLTIAAQHSLTTFHQQQLGTP